MKRIILSISLVLSTLVFSQETKVDELISKLAFQKQDTSKVNLSLKIIKHLYTANDYSKLKYYINETKKLSNTLGYTKGIAAATYYLAELNFKQQKFYSAERNFKTAIKLQYNLNDYYGIAKSKSSLGFLQAKKGNYRLGIKNLNDAITLYKKKNLPSDLSFAYTKMADIYVSKKEYNTALTYYSKTLDLHKELNDLNGTISTLINIGNLYVINNDPNKALEFYNNAFGLTSENSKKEVRAIVLNKIGEQYLHLKEYINAEHYFTKGLMFCEKHNLLDTKIALLISFAKLHTEQNKLELATKELDNATAYNSLFNSIDYKLENYKLRKEIDSIKGNYKTAYSWQKKYFELYSASFLKQEDYGNEDEDSINIEQNNYNTANSNSTFTTYHIIYLSCILVLVAGGVIFLLNFKRQKKILQKNNERVEVFKNQHEKLKSQKNHLEELNQVKDKLFSIVSHDLKDSISSIKAFIDLLKDDIITEDEFKNLLPELSENADNASSLLYNLLNWSKSQMQNLEPNPELFNIQEVFKTKIALVEQKLDDKKIVLIDESKRDYIYADRSMIEIVVQNLITNAVKFSRKGDIITLTNKNENGKALITISDTGIGIEKDNLNKLFNAEKNFTTIGTKNEKGTGLGLTIVKDLVELNNGKIWVESEINVGSKFSVELPRIKPKV